MMKCRSDKIAGPLPMPYPADLLPRDRVAPHQADGIPHRLVVGFDDCLVARDQRLHGYALGCGKREIPPVALGCRPMVEGRLDASAVRQAPFEQGAKLGRIHRTVEAQSLRTLSQPDSLSFLRVVIVLCRE